MLSCVSVEFNISFVYALGLGDRSTDQSQLIYCVFLTFFKNTQLIYCVFLTFLLFQRLLTSERITPLTRENCLLLPSFPVLSINTICYLSMCGVFLFVFVFCKKKLILSSPFHTETLDAIMWHKGRTLKGTSKSS